MDTISTPLASLGSVVGWAYVIFVPLLWFFGIHGALALTALDNGIMTPWALENIATYQQYGSVEAALALSLIHISEPTRLGMISYAVFCLKKKNNKKTKHKTHLRYHKTDQKIVRRLLLVND